MKQVTKINQRILERAIKCWMDASQRLQFRIVAPYVLEVEGQTANCIAFLPDFGGPAGMIIGALIGPDLKRDSELLKLARKKELFSSFVNLLGWLSYDEALFKEALEDWGYYGRAENCPSWFQGYRRTGSAT
jgi:hypothetical protein